MQFTKPVTHGECLCRHLFIRFVQHKSQWRSLVRWIRCTYLENDLKHYTFAVETHYNSIVHNYRAEYKSLIEDWLRRSALCHLSFIHIGNCSCMAFMFVQRKSANFMKTDVCSDTHFRASKPNRIQIVI